MYNKNQYKKFNDKKILHKVKKQWVTISLALLMMIGGGAVATHVNASANTATDANPQITSNASQSNSVSNITNQAKVLHNNMVRNTGLSQANLATLGASKAVNNPKIVKTAKWDNANVNYYNNDVMELTGNGSINASDVPHLPINSNNYDWQLKISKSNANISLNNNENGGQFSANFEPLWKNFKSMDLSGLNTSHVTNMSSMFENDTFLDSLDLSSFNTNNVTSMDYMFNNDGNLTDIDMSHFNTTKASMKHMFNGTENLSNLSRFTIGNNTKLNTNNDLQFGTPLSDDPMTPWNYYPVTHNTLLYNDNLIVNDHDDNVTESFKNNTLPAGTYYVATFIDVDLVPQNGGRITTGKGFLAPVMSNKSVTPKFYSNTHISIPKLVQKTLANTKIFDNDYTINNGLNYIPLENVGIASDSSATQPAIGVRITVNNSKYLHDANKNVQSEDNKASHYKAKINSDKPYLSDLDYNYAINDVDFANLQNNASDTQHILSEPVTPNAVASASNAESMANYAFDNLTSEYNSVTSATASNKSWNTQDININKAQIDTAATDGSLASDNINLYTNELNASERSLLTNDKTTLDNLSNRAKRASNIDPTYSNVSAFHQMRTSATSAIRNMDNIFESVKAASSRASQSVKPSSKTSINSDKSSSSIAPSSTSSDSSSKVNSNSSSDNYSSASAQSSSASSSINSNTSQSNSANSQSSSQSLASSQASTSSVSFSSTSSIAPSSTSSASSSKVNTNASGDNYSSTSSQSSSASSSINSSTSQSSSANSQSSSQSLASSQASTSSVSFSSTSSVASSSEQQSSNNSMPITPSTPSSISVVPNNNSSVVIPNESLNNNVEVNYHSMIKPNIKKQNKRNHNIASHYVTVPNRHIALNGVSHHTRFYIHSHDVKLSRKAIKHAYVISYVRRGHEVRYIVKIGKHYGHVYGYVKNIKPLFANAKRVNVYVGHRRYSLNRKAIKRIHVAKAVRKGANVTYKIKINRKRSGIIYAKVTKRVLVRNHKANKRIRKVASHYVTVPNKQIVLNGVSHHAEFYVHGHNIKLSRKAIKHAYVISYVRRGHEVRYIVKIGKHYGHVYGYVKNIKPLFANAKRVNVYVGHRRYSLNRKAIKRIHVAKAVRKGANVTYKIKINRKRSGIIYAKLTKRVLVHNYRHKLVRHAHY